MILFVPIFLGGLIKSAFGAIKGAIGGAIGAQLPRQPQGFRVQIPTPGFGARVQRFLPGGSTGFTTLPPGLIPRGPGGIIGAFPGVPGGVTGFAGPRTQVATTTQANGCPTECPSTRRTHLNRSGYYVQSVPGSPEMGGTWIAPESVCVTNRVRNLSNGRANRRALSRAKGLGRQMKTLRKAARELSASVR